MDLIHALSKTASSSGLGQLRTPATYPCYVRSWGISRRNQHDNGRRQKPFHGRRKKIQILAGRQPAWDPYGFRGERRLFLQDAGADARTGEVSISSSRRATAGVQVSIDLGLGPLFALNAVWASRASPGRGLRARRRRTPLCALLTTAHQRGARWCTSSAGWIIFPHLRHAALHSTH